MNITTGTGLSVGIVVILFGGFAWVLKGQNDMESKLSLQALRSDNEINKKIDRLDARMTSMESTKSSWTATDMFRWAVHLQQLNKDPKKLQAEGLVVPEPEVNQK